MNKTIGREKPTPILLKDEYNRIIDNNLAADNFCEFLYSTYTQDNGKMPHINKLYEDMKDDIIFRCDDFIKPYYINSQMKSLPDRIVYPIYY